MNSIKKVKWTDMADTVKREIAPLPHDVGFGVVFGPGHEKERGRFCDG